MTRGRRSCVRNCALELWALLVHDLNQFNAFARLKLMLHC